MENYDWLCRGIETPLVYDMIYWDYNIPSNFTKYSDNQQDWNRTLVTRFNQIHGQLNKLRMTPKEGHYIKISNKFKYLILDSNYYNEKTNIIDGRFKVIFTPENTDTVDVGGIKMKIVNYDMKKQADLFYKQYKEKKDMENKTFEEYRKAYEVAGENLANYIKSMNIKEYGDDMTEEEKFVFDKCVVCGKLTPYPKTLDISLRHCYVEGGGQLCVDCCKKRNN